MDGVLTAPQPVQAAKSKKAEGFRFLFPGADSWEVWSRTPSGALEPGAKKNPEESGHRWVGSSFLAIPIRYCVVVPLWLSTRDQSLMKEMVWLQLERKGLLNGSREETVMEFKVLREEAGRSLVAVSILSENFPEPWALRDIRRYPLVTDLLKLPDNQLVLWKELGQQVFVFTAGGEVVYAQSFPVERPDQNLVQDALCALLQLQSEGVLDSCSGITALGAYSRQELEPLARTLGIPVSIQQAAVPVQTASTRNLIPNSLRILEEKRKKGARSQKLWTVAGLVYLVLAAAVLGHLGWLVWKTKGIQKAIALHKNEVEIISGTASRWEAMELAIMPETYPVEMLFRCTRQLPEDGVRLVTFDQTGTRVLMTGEAKSSSAAFQFLQDLKKSKDLAAYQWEMPPPKLLQNDAAQFQIEGKRSYAPANNQ